MATFLDISILSHFTTVFTFIFVFLVVFGLLEAFKLFNSKGTHAMIALSIGMLTLFSTGVVAVIQTFVPWFTILILVLFFIFFLVRMFGVDTAYLTSNFKENATYTTWIIILTALIFLFSLGAGFGQQNVDRIGQGSTNGTVITSTTSTTTTVNSGTATTANGGLSTNTGDFNQNLFNTLYHPKVLGMILMLLLVVIAMLLLTTSG